MRKGVFAAICCVMVLGGCSGEYDKQMKLAKSKVCELKAAEAKLAQKKDLNLKDLNLKEKVLRLKRYIKIHADNSGKPEKFMKELAKVTCK